MTQWTDEQLQTIEDNEALYVSPFREDGVTYGTPTETWALVVDGNVYVRAANGLDSSWYQAAIAQGAGRVRVADRDVEVVFEASGNENESQIDAAYQDKYATAEDAFAIPIMQGAGPKRAAVKITPRNVS